MLFTSCVVFDQVLFPVHQFPQLQNENNTYLMKLFEGLNGLIRIYKALKTASGTLSVICKCLLLKSEIESLKYTFQNISNVINIHF